MGWESISFAVSFGMNQSQSPVAATLSLTHTAHTAHTHTPLDEILTTKNRPLYLKMSGEERVCVVAVVGYIMLLCTRNSLSLSCIAFVITLASVVIL